MIINIILYVNLDYFNFNYFVLDILIIYVSELFGYIIITIIIISMIIIYLNWFWNLEIPIEASDRIPWLTKDVFVVKNQNRKSIDPWHGS